MSNAINRLRVEGNKKAFREGRAAALAGRHAQTNPYHDSSLFTHWAEGHKAGLFERGPIEEATA